MKFSEGTTVSWQSQSGGSWVAKTGVIVKVIPAGGIPSGEHAIKGCGTARDHESYVVAVANGKTSKAKPTLYWPRVSALKVVA